VAPLTEPRTTLWANQAFRRVWTAETISIFGSFITRMALPLVAIPLALTHLALRS